MRSSRSGRPQGQNARIVDTTHALTKCRARRVVVTRLVGARQRSAWAVLIAATLVFKTFVPLLAAASAHLQGRSVAEICSIYGVALPAVTGHAHGAHSHASHHMAAMAGSGASGKAPADHDPAAHTQDHCALSGLATCALFAASLWIPAPWLDTDAAMRVSLGIVEPPRDASARWLTLRLHAPPRQV